MKKKFMVLASFCALSLFTACAEDEPDPTRAELCAEGLTEECLIGVWNLNGVYVQDLEGNFAVSPIHDFRSNPSKLEFQKNGDMVYTPSSASLNTEVAYGTWSIEENKLTIRTKVGNTLLERKTLETTPTIKVNGAFVEMDIGSFFFTNPDLENASLSEKAISTEIYTIAAD